MTNATLVDRLSEAIADDADRRPISGDADRKHWLGIIERHQPDRVPTSNPGMWYCEGCSTSECEHSHDVDWPCREISALAERLDVVVL